MPRPRKTSPKRVEVAQRRAQAIALRQAGLTYQIIAERLGYKTPAAAAQDVQRAMRGLVDQPAKELRDLEASRLDALQVSLWTQARRGDLGAVDRVLRIMRQRAELLGLNAPTRHEVDATATFDAEIERLIAILTDAKAGGTPQ